MKTWVIVVLILVFVFVVVPLIMYVVTVRNAPKVLNSIKDSGLINDCGAMTNLAPPPSGKKYICLNKSWTLVNI